jgi:hypothetical protein
MRKLSLLLLAHGFALTLFAQRDEAVNPQKDKLEFEGYTIRILPVFGNTYGYDILKGKELVVHQMYNPFTNSPMGLSKKEDVYKVAKWQIKKLQEKNLMIQQSASSPNQGQMFPQLSRPSQRMQQNSINRQLSRSVAQELQIDIH